jgi:hypothetical protein
MKSDSEITKTQQEVREHNLRALYNDAVYWHLVHKGYTMKRAELEVSIRKNRCMQITNQ